MKHELLHELRAAFPPEPIIGAGAFQQRGRLYCDTHEYRRELDGKTWEQLDPRFFARTFKPTSPVPESLLPLLTRPHPTDEPTSLFEWRNERFVGMVTSLSDTQSKAVAATLLEFVASTPNEAEPAQRALDRYWRAFAQRSPIS